MPSAGADSALLLRPLRAEDLDRVHAWYQDERLFFDLVGSFMPRPRREAIAWMMRHWLDPASRDVRLAICRTADGLHIGNTYLTGIDQRSRAADFHILIGGAAHRGRGYGTAATRATVEHAFARLGLRRLRLEVLARNGAARRVYEKCGFVLEELRPRAVLKPDGWQDVCVMARTAEGAEAAPERWQPAARTT
ncbi:MAG TPA: GNAT family N-acetyltransferase [Stellaceae bacterium]|nr:GNAT family N-acetyltransferase [Stellaceae bacterium]